MQSNFSINRGLKVLLAAGVIIALFFQGVSPVSASDTARGLTRANALDGLSLAFASLPDTTLDSFPANPTHSSDATFTFSSDDNKATFECSLDSSAFAPCTSPTEFTGLAGGSHTFTVRARDMAGNVDPTPASYTWLKYFDSYLPAAIKNLPPVITGLDPPSTDAGGPAFTLTVNGTNFVTGSVVNWNGSPRSTTFISDSQLTATITAADILTPAANLVSVFNPALHDVTSEAFTFVVIVPNPVPTIISLSPVSLTDPGGIAFTLTVNGTNFMLGSVVNWNGSPRTTTYISAAVVKAAITAADIAAGGAYPVTVVNPAPGGGPSNAVKFQVGPVVINGGFEQGAVGWSQGSSHGWPIITSSPPIRHSGSWAAWLGGAYNDTSFVQQPNINLIGVRYLHFWYYIASLDSCGHDIAGVWVNGAVVKSFNLCGSANTNGWRQQVVDLNSYAGMAITLTFTATTNGPLNSNFFLDDVSITSASAMVDLEPGDPAGQNLPLPDAAILEQSKSQVFGKTQPH